MSKAMVLVIDDERDLVELVRYNLEREGYQVLAAGDGRAGLEAARRERPDLIVLDLMMPGLDGLEVCRRLREDERTRRLPIIMLTAKAAESDRVVGLEMGADDYLTKPFSPRELVARVKAVLRRSAADQEQVHVFRRGDLLIDTRRRQVTCGGQPVTLTATEFRILEALAKRPGWVLSREEIVQAALGRDTVVLDRTVDVHVTAIRKKLGPAGDAIETVRGFGYRLRERQPADSAEA